MKTDFLVAATGTLLVASIMVVPLAITLEQPWALAPSFASTAAIVWLGIGPMALATILYFRLISSAGPTLMSLVNYLSPAVAVFLGVMLLGEQPGVNAVRCARADPERNRHQSMAPHIGCRQRLTARRPAAAVRRLQGRSRPKIGERRGR